MTDYEFSLEPSHAASLAVRDTMRGISDLAKSDLSPSDIYDLELAHTCLGELLSNARRKAA